MRIFGAIVGDIVGSIYEFNNYRAKDFPLFANGSSFTDDSLMTIAVAAALMRAGRGTDEEVRAAAVNSMRAIGTRFPDAGYGSSFLYWLFESPEPYGSWGNGAAMRVSPVGWYARSETEVKRLSALVTSVSHDSPEGLLGAECTAMAVYLARRGRDKDEIVCRAAEYYPEIPTLECDKLRACYDFDVSCAGTVPQAMACFAEGNDFEDVLRNAVSIGGDTDTLAAIACAVADAYYGVPDDIAAEAARRLPPDLFDIVERFFSRL